MRNNAKSHTMRNGENNLETVVGTAINYMDESMEEKRRYFGTCTR
jgi:hypothetical protein